VVGRKVGGGWEFWSRLGIMPRRRREEGRVLRAALRMDCCWRASILTAASESGETNLMNLLRNSWNVAKESSTYNPMYVAYISYPRIGIIYVMVLMWNDAKEMWWVVVITKEQDLLGKKFSLIFWWLSEREFLCVVRIINIYLISEVHGPIEVRHVMTLRFPAAWSILNERAGFQFWMVWPPGASTFRSTKQSAWQRDSQIHVVHEWPHLGMKKILEGVEWIWCLTNSDVIEVRTEPRYPNGSAGK
jgi:hypothetical protein